MTSFAREVHSLFNRDKPHSSISELVEILSSANYELESYDGIPEIVESINIQATGPTEASRAVRKKLKHGTPHQQYRALVILKAIVENGGSRFQSSFADPQLTDAIKLLGSDPTTDSKVKKKLVHILAQWHQEYKDDPSMQHAANLYNQCKLARAERTHTAAVVQDAFGVDVIALERKQREEKERKRKEASKRKAKEEKERRRQEEAERKRRANQPKRKPFNFEEEKPQVLTAIANASQVTNNLVNAITLVNTQEESLQSNERVQDCLTKVKQSRKQIVRYIQLVENEDMIGILIETNDRIIAALENYDLLTKPGTSDEQVKDIQEGLAATQLSDSELGRLQQKQRDEIERSVGRAGGASMRPDSDGETSPHPYADLQDLNFGTLGSEQHNLPPPLRPSAPRSGSEEEEAWRRGSLSDYSDYESSDEESHKRASTSSAPHQYPQGRDLVDVDVPVIVPSSSKKTTGKAVEDPFADPFAD